MGRSRGPDPTGPVASHVLANVVNQLVSGAESFGTRRWPPPCCERRRRKWLLVFRGSCPSRSGGVEEQAAQAGGGYVSLLARAPASTTRRWRSEGEPLPPELPPPPTHLGNSRSARPSRPHTSCRGRRRPSLGQLGQSGRLAKLRIMRASVTTSLFGHGVPEGYAAGSSPNTLGEGP